VIQRPDVLDFVQASEKPVAACLRVTRRGEPSAIGRLLRALIGRRRSWRGKAAVLGACALAAILLMPAPYKVACDCQIEPVHRRFVAAPYEGTLEKSLAAPGELVSQGQLLARLDGREIRWEMAGLDADYIQAVKKRDSALANQNAAASQLAKLEMDRLQLQRRLLEHRAANLEIRSPIDGIVASGDLERAEGAPLLIGQTLFEIAPLGEMIAEIGVPEREIPYVHVGQEVALRLDAYPGRAWTATLTSIQPRAETRDHQSVFVAEVMLDNSDGVLRPGMHGRAKIATARRPLAWNLFHRPYEALAAALGF
jgi:RND family efflux transporter MFP subunit